MYHVVATDLDGTLLNERHALDPYTIDTVRRLTDDGIDFIIATGRHHADVAGIRDVLGIQPYLITANGARVHSPDGAQIHARDIDSDIVTQLVRPGQFGANEQVIVNLFTGDGWLIDRDAPHLLAFHRDSGFHYRVTDLPAYHAQDVAKVLYIGDPTNLAELAAGIERRFGDVLYVTYSLPDCLEVMTAGVSKGRALRVVLERLDIDPRYCVAFGDNLNDIDLLETAGHPFMMRNANPHLIERLPHVHRIGSNADAGVARHLRTLFALDSR